MPIRTKLTEALGIEHPIICGGMHFVGYAELAAAVSNAGGLGVITALTQKSPEALRAEIRKARSLTSKPIAVNLTLLPALVPPNYAAYSDVIIEEGVKVIETAGRNPEEFIRRFKSAGCFVIHKCVSVRHALTAARLGADMISMDGFECGGHPGEEDVGNWVLLAQAARKLPVPFVASGGCVTGRQLAAAISLGACGVNMGTRFLCTTEARVHPQIQQALCAATEKDTTLVMRSLKNTERVYKNTTSQEVVRREAEKPGEIGHIIDLVRGENYRRAFHETGDVDGAVWSCGQGLGLIDEVLPCAELLPRIVAEAEAALTAGAVCVTGASSAKL
eukprot:TRINITY_DN47997_c0_g1_i1.p1 TRINITY_DN47997_c0_g1~~TRINITY_DN47997_c0_g1_i1.p1  ORF type:complete len:333 (+),score=66.47 TRINITY_DN47997_c0_g1_i1:147-1145(+)